MISSRTSWPIWATELAALVTGVAAFWLAAPHPAAAHGGPPLTRRLAFHPTDPDTLYAQATFGLVFSRDHGMTWALACEESIGWQTTENPHIVAAHDGAIVFGLFRGLYRSSTFCDAELPEPSLERVPIISLDRDPASPMQLYAATSLGSFENVVYASGDDGLTWEPTADRFDVGELPEEIRVAPSAPRTLYVSGVRLEPRMGFVARSDDAGGSWTTYDVELRGALTVLLGAVDPNDARRVLAYRRYTDEPDALMLSEDGGETWDDVASVSGDLSAVAFAPDGSRVWYGGEEKGLHVSMDGGRTFEAQFLDLTIRCLAAREGELWVCADNFADGFAVGVSLDGGDSFEPRFRYREILGQIECAEGTRSAEVCPIAWRAIADLFGIEAGAPPARDAGTGAETREEAGPLPRDAGGSGVDLGSASGSDDEESGCGCRVGGDRVDKRGHLAAVSLALATGLWVRRRKRRGKRGSKQ